MTQNFLNPRQGARLPHSMPSRHWLMVARVGGGEWKYKLGGISLQNGFVALVQSSKNGRCKLLRAQR